VFNSHTSNPSAGAQAETYGVQRLCFLVTEPLECAEVGRVAHIGQPVLLKYLRRLRCAIVVGYWAGSQATHSDWGKTSLGEMLVNNAGEVEDSQ
jgi:hypothetical protein